MSLLPVFAGDDLMLSDIKGNKRSIDQFIGHGKWGVLNVWGRVARLVPKKYRSWSDSMMNTLKVMS